MDSQNLIDVLNGDEKSLLPTREIQDCRRALGLEPITVRKVKCKRMLQPNDMNEYPCERTYFSQFIGKRRQQHYCSYCRHLLGRSPIS